MRLEKKLGSNGFEPGAGIFKGFRNSKTTEPYVNNTRGHHHLKNLELGGRVRIKGAGKRVLTASLSSY